MPSSSSSSPCNYEVFLNFRGEDTRENFTSHLFKELNERKKIKTFIDEDLKRGEEISPTLLNAMEGSMISIIIFSKDYASSKWCLDELVKILQRKKTNGQIVIPVFYHVHPSEVRNQTGCYAEAFRKHEKNFKKMPGKVQNWRSALTEVTYLSGHESEKIRPESKLVDVIVKDVLKKLEDITVCSDSNGLVGINYRIEQVKSLLCIGVQDFRIIGIWGMGGIGKTTLAKAIFQQVSSDFEGKYFMENVRENLEKGVGLKHLQKEVLSHLLEETLEKDVPNIPQYTRERLRRLKVFTVLDDVNELKQLEYLVGGPDQFGRGSRIIVTTRDKQVLDQFGVDGVYQVEGLNYFEAKEHFTNFAFRQKNIPKDFRELSSRVVDYAKGNPLALKVLGSFLRSKNKLGWEIALHNLNRSSKPGVFDVLQISYNDLSPDVKDIFLDIACFFKGDDKEHVISIYDDHYLIHYALEVLNDKSLITISWNKLEMHDLLQKMGQEIVHEECPELGKRSRLWHHDDVCHVLKQNKGTDSIKGIFLNLSKIENTFLDSRVFRNMPKLKLLKFYMPWQFGKSKVHLPGGLEYLSDELRYLQWHGYSLPVLPINFMPDNLVELSLPYSKVQQLWKEKKEASKLKFVDLQHSQHLTRIPDPSETPNLERINLLNCINLSHVPSSIQHFSDPGLLCFKGCISLSCFPCNIHFRCPIKIDFSDCINLTVFPQISGNIIDLNLSRTAIEEVPSSIESLTSLAKLDLEGCERLTNLSTSICKLKSLHWFDLSFCSKFERFPKILEQMESLKYINLSSTKIKELPIELLTGLTVLQLSDCRELEISEDIGCLSSLRWLDLSENNFESIPESIKKLSQLRILSLDNCNMLQSLPELPPQLQNLSANNCRRLESLLEVPECLEILEASLLETISRRLDSYIGYALFWQECRFHYCLKLKEKANDILADSQLRIQHMAVALLKRFYFYKQIPLRMSIYLSGGGNIPEWFSNRCSGSSITIQLPQYSCNRNFVGFAVCAVLGFEEGCLPSDQDCFIVYCAYSFGTKTPSKTKHFGGAVFSRCTFAESDMVFLGFERCWMFRLPDSDHHATVSIDFNVSVARNDDRPGWISDEFPKVKCCGVCPMYAHLNEFPPNTFTVNMVPPTEEEYNQITKLNKDSATTQEEVEPSPKRICRENINATYQQASLFSSIFSRRVCLFVFLTFVVLLCRRTCTLEIDI